MQTALRAPALASWPRLAALLLLAAVAGAADEKPPALQEEIYQGQATTILGRPVDGPDNEQVGRIVDVLVDDQGSPRAAVIDVGGFMGLGAHKIAVAWRALRFQPAAQHHRIRIDMTENQIKVVPDYKPSDAVEAPPTPVAAPPMPPGTAPAAR